MVVGWERTCSPAPERASRAEGEGGDIDASTESPLVVPGARGSRGFFLGLRAPERDARPLVDSAACELVDLRRPSECLLRREALESGGRLPACWRGRGVYARRAVVFPPWQAAEWGNERVSDGVDGLGGREAWVLAEPDASDAG